MPGGKLITRQGNRQGRSETGRGSGRFYRVKDLATDRRHQQHWASWEILNLCNCAACRAKAVNNALLVTGFQAKWGQIFKNMIFWNIIFLIWFRHQPRTRAVRKNMKARRVRNTTLQLQTVKFGYINLTGHMHCSIVVLWNFDGHFTDKGYVFCATLSKTRAIVNFSNMSIKILQITY